MIHIGDFLAVGTSGLIAAMFLLAFDLVDLTTFQTFTEPFTNTFPTLQFLLMCLKTFWPIKHNMTPVTTHFRGDPCRKIRTSLTTLMTSSAVLPHTVMLFCGLMIVAFLAVSAEIASVWK